HPPPRVRTSPDFYQYDATGLAQLVRDGEICAGELLDAAITRAEAINPQINAIVRPMYEIARERAKEIDADRTAADRGFVGVPFLLKDLLQAYAGVPMMSGSAALRDYIPEVDSEVVTRFKRSGLITFGKTNVPEFGLVAT